jgi:hypothetical protein
VHSFGEFAAFRTYSFENGVAEVTPCYYLHNGSAKVVASDNWQCSYRIKFEYPMHEDVVVEGEYENANVSEFKVRVKRLVKLHK